jgi:hypothetical protein
MTLLAGRASRATQRGGVRGGLRRRDPDGRALERAVESWVELAPDRYPHTDEWSDRPRVRARFARSTALAVEPHGQIDTDSVVQTVHANAHWTRLPSRRRATRTIEARPAVLYRMTSPCRAGPHPHSSSVGEARHRLVADPRQTRPAEGRQTTHRRRAFESSCRRRDGNRHRGAMSVSPNQESLVIVGRAGRSCHGAGSVRARRTG